MCVIQHTIYVIQPINIYNVIYNNKFKSMYVKNFKLENKLFFKCVSHIT